MKKNFEENLNDLNDIVFKLSQGTTTLEDSMSLYEHGMKLLKDAEEQLKNAQTKIKMLEVQKEE